MITGAIISFFGFFIYSVIVLLPISSTFPDAINSSLTWIFQQAYGWNWLVPVDTIVSILGITMALYTGLFTFRGIKWILNLARGAGA